MWVVGRAWRDRVPRRWRPGGDDGFPICCLWVLLPDFGARAEWGSCPKMVMEESCGHHQAWASSQRKESGRGERVPSVPWVFAAQRHTGVHPQLWVFKLSVACTPHPPPSPKA